MLNKITKNRGSFSNPEGRFESEKKENFDDGWGQFDDEPLPSLETMLFIEKSKSIITKNDSPDISFGQSINPYRGCEHGCIYCYARPSHAYVNLSPGLDFESKIFYKNNAAELFENEILKPKYICKPIVIGANTDPYQPAESKLKITRSLLEVAVQYSHPIAIITKSSLILRDLDLLSMLAAKNLIRVAITVTTLNVKLKRILEPRASAPNARINTIKELASVIVPTTVMAAPMIPMINDMELEHILEAASLNGAKNAGYTLIRLPYEVKDLFKEWLGQYFPGRAEHVMSIIRQMRGGKEYDPSFGQRMRGTGKFSDLLATRFKLACKKFKLNQSVFSLTTDLFRPNKKYSDKQCNFQI